MPRETARLLEAWREAERAAKAARRASELAREAAEAATKAAEAARVAAEEAGVTVHLAEGVAEQAKTAYTVRSEEVRAKEAERAEDVPGGLGQTS
jgi:hypothetical protein